ncbi:MAG: UDP-N-acetylmuramoyl-tripeptide--D-alanyl-D-alanine ligase [Alphaproteobacteria bacterium]|nr:UDP-N-acetylmuramoyl-tripeptide--D-alanyl-D-alanine ligase [Alphaproteobacteria bacterium]MBU0795682.1 UDP-N-acetylmuramoyl-tripeptide--D-alanyl-D-alanine ligase [Alphaproteobacteria bacterium]MBU0887305.1 UDP-N-acetylmuramoyl-tripeptide--D-alanyl-D-alanine ligase [Alphaproteobacteria bacterium]MBU1811814.1 UDP-N-acetylmuramoyl-tripeptide--D-alanyl-D-alanine ligase [Alphaproteobacteria bacterium]
MTAILWTSADAVAATGGRNSRDWQAMGVSIDSRTVAEGDLFVAVKGDSFDGHDYALDALGRGAAAVLVERDLEGIPANAPVLQVTSTLEALSSLGRFQRGRNSAKAIAVTGSVGKTGSKEMLRVALSALGKTHASVASFNNHIGAPLTLARLPQDAAYLVSELGMNHAGELAPLSQMVRPDVALITNVEAVHAGHFDSEEEIADAKAEIFTGLTSDGIAVLNRDNRHFARLRDKARAAGVREIVAFGSDLTADAFLVNAQLSATGSQVQAVVGRRRLSYKLAAPGRHWVMNSLGVLAGIAALGGDVVQAAAALVKVEVPKGRGRQVHIALPKGGSLLLIDESYNASAPAIRAALDVMKMTPVATGGRRVVVLGDMLELGDAAPATHEALAPALVESGAVLVLTVGPNMARLAAMLPKGLHAGHADTAQELAPLVSALVRSGDVVLVKGSLGMKMARIVEALTALHSAAAGA